MSRSNRFTIAVRKFAPFESAMQHFWERFCAHTGCTLELDMVVMDLHELYDRTLAKGGLRDGSFDVAHINTDWLLDGYFDGAFDKLDAYIKVDPPEDFPKGWSSSLLELQKIDDHIVGLPFHDGPECLIYRKDLFEDVKEQSDYREKYGVELKVPTTWSEFHQVSKFFNRPEQNLYGSIFAGYPDGHNAVFDYCLQLWTRGGDLLDQHDQIRIDTAASKAALGFYRTLINDQTAVHPASFEFDSVAAGIAFSQGQAAMMINWFGFAAMCEVDQDSLVKGKVDVTFLPADQGHSSASLNVYWLYTIGSGSVNKEIAYQFLQFVTNMENDKLLTLAGGIGCRRSTWADREINKLIPFYHKLDEIHGVAKMLPQRKNWSNMVQILDNMMQQTMHTDQSLDTILDQAQEQINFYQSNGL